MNEVILFSNEIITEKSIEGYMESIFKNDVENYIWNLSYNNEIDYYKMLLFVS